MDSIKAIDTVHIKKQGASFSDTIVITTSKYSHGNENKLKDILGRIPEFNISRDGSVSFNGKLINSVSIENQEFFNGTNLAINNIPFNSIEKIEIISDKNDGENRNKINIRLKEDKKNKIFGNISSSLGKKEYSINTNLFLYKKKYSFNLIGDNNNIGNSSLTTKDLIEFNGGVEAILKNTRSFFNNVSFRELLTLMNTDNKLYTQNYFWGNNFFLSNKKLKIKGFIIYNEALNKELSFIQNSYSFSNIKDFSNNNTITETSLFISKINTTHTFTRGNIKYDFFLKRAYQSSDTNMFLSISNYSQNTIINTKKNNINTTINNIFDFQYSFSNSFSLQNSFFYNLNNSNNNDHYNNSTLINSYFFNVSSSEISQKSIFNTLNIGIQNNFIYKIGHSNHLSLLLNYSYYKNTISISNQHSTSNNINTKNISFGVKHTLKHKKLDVISEFLLDNKSRNTYIFTPKISLNYKLKYAEEISLSAQRNISYIPINFMFNGISIDDYNNIFIGNPNIIDYEDIFSSNISYFKSRPSKKLNYNFLLSYSKTLFGITNNITTYNISRINSPINQKNVKEHIYFSFNINKKFKNIFDLKIHNNFQRSKKNYLLNNILTENINNIFSHDINIKRRFDKLSADVEIGLNIKNNYLNNGNKIIEKTIYNNIEYYSKKFTIISNTDINIHNYTKKIDVQNNLEIKYFPLSNLTLSVQIKNLFNDKEKEILQNNEYIFTEYKNYIRPRMIFINLNYSF